MRDVEGLKVGGGTNGGKEEVINDKIRDQLHRGKGTSEKKKKRGASTYVTDEENQAHHPIPPNTETTGTEVLSQGV